MRVHVVSTIVCLIGWPTIDVAVAEVAARQMEFLDRGLVAVKRVEGGVFLSWRLLGNEPDSAAFNVYRMSEQEVVRLNDMPITNATNFIDRTEDLTHGSRYFVCVMENEKERPPSEPAVVWRQNYLEIPIQSIVAYRPGDASVGDLDGDGQYEIVLHQISRPRDNSHAGITGKPILDAYKLDGSHLWRIDLGINGKPIHG